MLSMTTAHPTTRSAMTMPAVLLRLEGLALFGTAIALYAGQGYSWLVFALFLLAPDLAIAVYAINKRVGAMAYNLVHTYSLPLALGLLSLWASQPLGMQIALIWLAHIGMDRVAGYGLKYTDDFKHTHLSEV